MFAGVSGDTNPVHLDQDYASKTNVPKEAEACQTAEACLTADQEEDENREKTLRDAEEVAHAAKKLALDKDVATEATQRVNQLFTHFARRCRRTGGQHCTMRAWTATKNAP